MNTRLVPSVGSVRRACCSDAMASAWSWVRCWPLALVATMRSIQPR